MTNDSEFAYRGAIVRIRIRNFMTYTDTELVPGPNLNMILGPNGTGKSAVVCCIIVGLAGEVSLTGRGGSPADFVKKDTDSGSTEIELYNNRGQNYIVKRKIIITNRSQFKIDHKSEWRINGKVCRQIDVQALTKKLSIKVDNLCQFLPQDSVTQFVKMNTCELLLNTLKAAGDNQLVEDHQKLIEYTKDVDEKRQTLQGLEKSCRENEVHAKRLESEVHQLRERKALCKQKEICSRKIQYVKYLEAKSNCDRARVERDKSKDDLKEIEAVSEPYRRAVDFHKSEETRLHQAIEKSGNEVKSSMNLFQITQNTIETRKVNCQEEFAKFKGKQEQENQRESSIRLKQQELDSLQSKMIDTRDVDCSKQIAAIEVEKEALRKQMIELKRERSSIDDKIRSYVDDIENLKRDRIQIKAVNEKKNNLLKARFPEAHKVLDWLAINRGIFKKHIFNPLMCEINVKDPKYSRIIENAVPRQELSSFICQDTEDLKNFTRTVRDNLKLRFNVILAPEKTMEDFQHESSQGPNLSHLGVKHYLKDLIDAPEPVMRYLCGSHSFHRIPVADSCSETQLKQLLQICPKFYVGGNFYTVSKSRYDKQSMTVTDTVRDAIHLQFSLDAKRLAECTQKLERYINLREEHVKKREDLAKIEDEKRGQWEDKNQRYTELKNKQDEKKRLEVLIKRKETEIENLRNEKIDIEKERIKLKHSIDKINKDILGNLDKLVKICDTFVKLKEIHMTNLLLAKLATQNHKLAYRKYTSAQRDTSRLKEDIRRKQQQFETFQAALNECMRISEERIPEFKNGKLDENLQRKFDILDENTIEELSLKLDDLTVRIQRIAKNSGVLAEFQRQNEELRDKRSRIADLEASIKQVDAMRDVIKKSWLPKLEEVVNVIDKHYREFMRKLSYDGQVKLDFDADEPNNFSAYGIMILVKYRDNENLIPLSSTRQSGGERSVATMIYMLALQTKTSVPFRCVDEINQGMDKENERKVFELLVKTADSSSSQYFLVSPKLLSNLPYSEKMKIHVVFNGKKLDLTWNNL